MSAILGRKVGMTRFYTEDGTSVPVTVIEATPNVVTQVKTSERDGYSAIQLGFSDVRPRNSTMPIIGHDAKAGTTPKRHHHEVRFDSDKEAEQFELGQAVTVEQFEGVKYVDISGTSKGKGFAGVMKRHNFAGLGDSHGVLRVHRTTGSIGGHATNRGTGPKPKKGKRMPGRMGNEQVTCRSLDIVSIDPQRGLLMVKGPVPGANSGLLFICESKRLNRKKARIAKTGK